MEAHLIRGTECERLQTIFNELIPSMRNGLVTRDIDNIEEVLAISLPNLRTKAFKLAERCRKDDGCNSDCRYCSPDFIYNTFEKMSNEVDTHAR